VDLLVQVKVQEPAQEPVQEPAQDQPLALALFADKDSNRHLHLIQKKVILKTKK
jgi:hypothetical protein